MLHSDHRLLGLLLLSLFELAAPLPLSHLLLFAPPLALAFRSSLSLYRLSIPPVDAFVVDDVEDVPAEEKLIELLDD